ncbi:lysylphosphatidylglycerol synthase transmembrane domain-containing protein [Pseudotenacibaculum sp. MALMAid0570]|uniref:lysylphosphatidylglycerol synthase transmembrane domain-containing protein n=1 Tax=Pseudotenacibaculum sp. MALMAid0570 TaxID=3143938 RepID=UPI0032E04DF1
MNPIIKKALQIIIPFGFGGFLVWYSLSDIDLNKLLDDFKNANYWWIGLSLLFGILSHISRAYRWSFMLEPMGYNPKLTNNVLAVLVGYLVNYTIPRAGEASRAIVLTNYEKIPFEKSFGTIVAERIADLLMLFVIIIITLFLQFDFIWELLTKNFDPIKIGVIIGGLLIAFTFFVFYIKKAKSGIGLKIKNFASGLIEGMMSIFKMKKKWSFIFHTVFIWIMYILMFWVVTFSIEGLSVPLGAILVGFIAGAFSIAVTPGGIGSYPLSVAAAFVLFGVAEGPSESFGWIMWSSQTAMVIFFGGLSFLALPIYNKQK